MEENKVKTILLNCECGYGHIIPIDSYLQQARAEVIAEVKQKVEETRVPHQEDPFLGMFTGSLDADDLMEFLTKLERGAE